MTDELKKSKITIKKLAKQLKVSDKSIRNIIKQYFPNKLENGKTTFLNEKEVSVILKEYKTNTKRQEQLTSEAGAEVQNTTTNFLEIQEAQTKSLEGVEAIKKLSIQDQYRLSMQIQQNILKQLGEQNTLLLEQNNKILQLNEQLQKQNEKLQHFQSETLYLENAKYKAKELRTKINKEIRKIAQEKFNNNYKNTWDFFYNKYSSIHCFTTKQDINLIQERGDLKEFYNLIINYNG